MQNITNQRKTMSTSTITKVAILSAIAYILMFISAPIPALFPDFLKIDVSDIPAIFGGMALGPVAGFMIVVVKNGLQAITASTTGGVGEFANIMIGGVYVVILSYSYRNKKNMAGVVRGFILGTIFMTIMGCIMNYYVMLPLYSKLGWSLDVIIGMGYAVNHNVKDLFSFVVWIIAPFNILKAVMMSLITLPLYKRMERILKK